MGSKHGPLSERFDRHWMPEPNTGCWLWFGCWEGMGYGTIKAGPGLGLVLAHRVSYELHKGPIPDGLLVLHRCDTPACVNPEHLFLGTTRDNTMDMIEKGRRHNNSGERNGRSRLTAEQVLAIRADPRPARVVAAEYRLSVSYVQNNIRGRGGNGRRSRRRWAHLDAR